jgi:transglutaminase-like putative cysteine protease
MRIRIRHQTIYRYEVPPSGVIQILRLTPRNHEGQYVVDWRIDMTADSRLSCHEDAFGNIVHTFTADGPVSEISVQVEGDVETQDTSGIIRGAVERFPPSLFLRETALTAPDAAIHEFARTLPEAVGGTPSGDVLKLLHLLLDRLHSDPARATGPAPPTATGPSLPTATAAQAFACGGRESQDLAHIFIATARSLGVPARYVAGYFHDPESLADYETGHAWTEAFVPGLGWVGFDPVNGICPTDAHVRVAVGLDYQSAAPVRASRYGGGSEARSVAITVSPRGQADQQQAAQE